MRVTVLMSDQGPTTSIATPVCRFCQQGQLRPMRCRDCGRIVVVCDECELIWRTPVGLIQEPHRSADGSHPDCPHCQREQSSWELLTAAELQKADLNEWLQ